VGETLAIVNFFFPKEPALENNQSNDNDEPDNYRNLYHTLLKPDNLIFKNKAQGAEFG
jgi:hypothetical protein